jgi:hypothetical protein
MIPVTYTRHGQRWAKMGKDGIIQNITRNYFLIHILLYTCQSGTF